MIPLAMGERVLATDRSVIRRIDHSDYDSMFAVYSDLELMRYVGDGDAITPEDCRRWIDITLANYEKRGYGLFLVEESGTGELVGFVGLTHPGGQAEPEIKYVVRPKFAGHGLATEVVCGLSDHACKHWALDQIIATVHPDNVASLRILEKCGYVQQPDRIDEDGSATVLWRLVP